MRLRLHFVLTRRIIEKKILFARATKSGQSFLGNSCECATSHILLRDIFRSSLGDEIQFKTHRAYYGSIVNEKEVIDDVVVLTFAKGKSFTGEESFEINCHGSEVVISQILRLLVAKGARLAEAGEFSKRAFLNGRLALSEAEAIMDMFMLQVSNLRESHFNNFTVASHTRLMH